MFFSTILPVITIVLFLYLQSKPNICLDTFLIYDK